MKLKYSELVNALGSLRPVGRCLGAQCLLAKRNPRQLRKTLARLGACRKIGDARERSAWLGDIMATRKETVRICDVCKKRVSDEGETHFGGHPHNGWFALHQSGGSTDLASLRKQREWDVCGIECLRKPATSLVA